MSIIVGIHCRYTCIHVSDVFFFVVVVPTDTQVAILLHGSPHSLMRILVRHKEKENVLDDSKSRL